MRKFCATCQAVPASSQPIPWITALYARKTGRKISETRFLHALTYCMLPPGPEAQELAPYVGWLLPRRAGGIAAGLLFVLPGALVVLVLSVLYASYREVAWVAAGFATLKPAVLAVVVEAVLAIGRR